MEVRLNPLKICPYIFLFYFPEFLMIDLLLVCCPFYRTVEVGSSTWELIEMQREARAITRILLPTFTLENEKMNYLLNHD